MCINAPIFDLDFDAKVTMEPPLRFHNFILFKLLDVFVLGCLEETKTSPVSKNSALRTGETPIYRNSSEI